jgi:hypothetical protein
MSGRGRAAWAQQSFPSQSRSYNDNWISFVAPSRRGRKLPESLWPVAVELAREHGVYSVAHPLRLNSEDRKSNGGVEWRQRNRCAQLEPFTLELLPIPPHCGVWAKARDFRISIRNLSLSVRTLRFSRALPESGMSSEGRP